MVATSRPSTTEVEVISQSREIPALPNEILLMIFQYLHKHDLHQLRLVNSRTKALASPLLYKWGVFSKYGLYFPGAPNPYPFLEILPIGQKAFTQREEDRLISGLVSIEVRKHYPHDCDIYGHQFPSHEGFVRNNFAPEVLKIEMLNACPEHSRSVGSITGGFVHEHYTEDNRPYVVQALTPEHQQSLCRKRCCYLDQTAKGDAAVRKLVVRNAPLQWYDPEWFEPGYEPGPIPVGRSATEYVAVVDSGTLHPRTKQDCPDCWGDVMDWGLRPLPPQHIKHMTIVFRTETPEADWAFPCQHYEVMPPDAGQEYDDNFGVCLIPETLWNDFQGLVDFCYRLERVTIVNAEAIAVPYPGHELHRPENPKESREDILDFFTPLHYGKDDGACVREDGTVFQVDFATMDEWVDSGAWEDVFSPGEIAPWLEASRRRRAEEQLRSARKRKAPTKHMYNTRSRPKTFKAQP